MRFVPIPFIAILPLLLYNFSFFINFPPKLFDKTAPGKTKLAPLLRAAMSQKRVTAKQFNGFWMDIGTPERLDDLDKHYAAIPNN